MTPEQTPAGNPQATPPPEQKPGSPIVNPKRTSNDVQMESGKLFWELGTLTYELEETLPEKINKIKNKLIDLNREGEKLFEKEQKAAAARAALAKAEADKSAAEKKLIEAAAADSLAQETAPAADAQP